MSDEATKKMQEQIDRLTATIARMEAENSGLKKQIPDATALTRELNRDPLKFLQKYGGNVDHVTKTLVTHALGDQADPVLRAQVGMGPMLANQADLAEEVRALRQRLDESESKVTRESTRTALMKLAADKKKYPHLASVVATDPSVVDGDVTAGNPEEIAVALEARLAATARALGITAPQATEDTSIATSTEARRPVSDVPPIPTTKGFSEEDAKSLRDEVVRKYERGEYARRT